MKFKKGENHEYHPDHNLTSVKSVEKKDWPNSCLGLPEANEACSDVVTPGWLVVFTANGQDYRFRVDQTGTMIRREP